MPVEFKDYYKTLGVGKNATDDEIKSAFRKLARKYHPDVARDEKGAEEIFKEVNEANEVLSDPERRKKYDEMSVNWQDHEQSTGGAAGSEFEQAGGQSFHFTGTGFSDFFERFFGGGFSPGSGDEGSGGSRVNGRRGADIKGEISVTLAEVMHGTTRPITLETVNRQTGKTEQRSFEVRIPPGASEGTRIRLRGKGEPGIEGAASGDLLLRTRYSAHPDFEVRGTDVFHQLSLAPWEAVLGTSVVAPTLEGTLKIKIAPATQPATNLRVRGQGLLKGRSGKRGDLYYVVNIGIPRLLTGEEKKLWEELGQKSRFDPREKS